MNTREDLQRRLASNPALAALNPHLSPATPLTCEEGSITDSDGKRPPAPARRGDGYDSDTERDYANHLDALKQAGEIVHWAREPILIRLVRHGNRWRSYRPDFLVRTPDGLELHETKGGFVAREARIGEMKLDLAAGWARNFGIKLFRVTRERGRWIKQEV